MKISIEITASQVEAIAKVLNSEAAGMLSNDEDYEVARSILSKIAILGALNMKLDTAAVRTLHQREVKGYTRALRERRLAEARH